MPVVRFLLSGVCHQLDTRCLHYQGQPLPLCARCTGTFLGILIGLCALRVLGQGRRAYLPPWRSGLVLGGLVGLWGIDGLNSAIQLVTGTGLLYEPRNSLRLITGLGIGLAISAVLYPIYHATVWRQNEERRVLDRPYSLIGLLLAGALLAVGILAWTSAPYPLAAGIVTGATLAVLGLVNMVLVVLILGREGFAEHVLKIIPYGLVGLLLTLLELGTLAWARSLLIGPSLAS